MGKIPLPRRRFLTLAAPTVLLSASAMASPFGLSTPFLNRVRGNTPPGGGITLLAHAHVEGDSGVTTSGINPTGATLLVIFVASYAPAGSWTISDSLGNTWTPLTRYFVGGGETQGQFFYVANPTVGAGQTFTGVGGFGTLQVSAWSGVVTTSPLDNSTGNGLGPSAGVSTIQPGTLTPSIANCLVLTGEGNNNNGGTSQTVDSGFTVIDSVNYAAGNNEAGTTAYLVQGAAGAVNPTWTLSSSTDVLIAAMAVFKP